MKNLIFLLIIFVSCSKHENATLSEIDQVKLNLKEVYSTAEISSKKVKQAALENRASPCDEWALFFNKCDCCYSSVYLESGGYHKINMNWFARNCFGKANIFGTCYETDGEKYRFFFWVRKIVNGSAITQYQGQTSISNCYETGVNLWALNVASSGYYNILWFVGSSNAVRYCNTETTNTIYIP